MALNFPNSPTLNQLYSFNKKTYKWDGVSWKQLNTTKERFISEYADFYSNTTSNNITLDLRTFNNFQVAVTTNTDITVVPNGSIFSQFVMQLDYTSAGYDTSVEGYYLDTASYDNVRFSANASDPDSYFSGTSLRSVRFSPDGIYAFFISITNGVSYALSLSSPWDLSSATGIFAGSFLAAQATNLTSIFFKPDGTKLYATCSGTDRVYQYTLSTPWALNTASYDSVNFSIVGQSGASVGLFFKPDGTKMFIIDGSTRVIYQYTLSTPWAINTASYDSVSFSVATQNTGSNDLFFNADGTKMFTVDINSDNVYEYALSTPWVVNTASYDNDSFSVATQDNNPTGVFFKPDGTKMYMIGLNNRVYQYTTAAPAYHTINWSNNVIAAPNTPFFTSSSIIEFTTFDGREWTSTTLSSVTG